MIIKCKMCGGDLAFEPGSTVCECEYCGSKQTIPSADSEKKTNLFNRANRLRMNSEFDKASAVYEQIVAEFPEEAEAYWGLCLCAYGIEYVDDPATGSKIPTCHRTLPTSIMEDSNFEQACDYADVVARKVYREEAKTIDRIQKDILSIAQNETPYDVFICYKETAEDGSRTEDSVLAQDVYEALTAKGLKVFFSRITLEDKLGTQYEPYIYAALSSAKVMLAFGTTYEYYDAVWVKNEWSRFLGMMKVDKRKTLIPCFKGLDAYDMPKEFRGLQAQDMAKLGWMQDLVRGVEKLCGKGGTASSAPNTVVQKTVVQEVQESGKADNLMKRVYLYLEDRDFAKASEYIDKVLDVDAEYAPAYVAQILVEHKLTQEKDIANLGASIDDKPAWKKALRFSNEQEKQLYLGYSKQINDKIAHGVECVRFKNVIEQIKQKQEKYELALSKMQEKDYPSALSILTDLENYKSASELLRQCIDTYREKLIIRLASVKEIPALIAQQKVKDAEQQSSIARNEFNKLKEESEEREKRKNKIQTQIYELNKQIGQTHGIFSGKKKQKLQNEIAVLEKEQSAIERLQHLAEPAVAKAEEELQIAKSILEEVRAALKTAQDEQQAGEQWTDEAILEAAKKEAKLQPGQYLALGRYPQTRDESNCTSIEWLILKREKQRFLIISRNGLDAQPYNNIWNDVTWEKSTLRTWLNNTFYSKAFTSAEQISILTTTVNNGENNCYSKWNTNGGNSTRDKVFLLSCIEANNYFGVINNSDYIGAIKNNLKSRTAPTMYATGHGAYANPRDKTTDGVSAGWWWLRSPGNSQTNAAYVSTDGSLFYGDVTFASGLVRPAMWVDLESLIFQA